MLNRPNFYETSAWSAGMGASMMTELFQSPAFTNPIGFAHSFWSEEISAFPYMSKCFAHLAVGSFQFGREDE